MKPWVAHKQRLAAEYVDFDYWAQLSANERYWLFRFIAEYYYGFSWPIWERPVLRRKAQRAAANQSVRAMRKDMMRVWRQREEPYQSSRPNYWMEEKLTGSVDASRNPWIEALLADDSWLQADKIDQSPVKVPVRKRDVAYMVLEKKAGIELTPQQIVAAMTPGQKLWLALEIAKHLMADVG